MLYRFNDKTARHKRNMIIQLREIEICSAHFNRKLVRPLFSERVQAGFPSPADRHIEDRIDLNQELIRHPLATFYVRVIGDSMIDEGIFPGTLLVVDRAEQTKSGDIVLARINADVCVKELSIGDDGSVWLLSKNPSYPPIEITEEMEFEVWGRVMWSITPHPLQ